MRPRHAPLPTLRLTRPSVVGRRQEARTDLANSRADTTGEVKRSHIFDGKTMSKETAAYQLCDLEDAMLKEMVEDDEELRETCNVRLVPFPPAFLHFLPCTMLFHNTFS